MMFSICIPCFNAEKTIKRAIESVIFQTFTNWELIVIDDCSTDATVSIAMQFVSPQIKVVTNKENLGIARNWNKSYKLATGDWVLLLGHDDYLAEDCLTEIDNVIQTNISDLGILAFTGYFKQINFINKRPFYGLINAREMFKAYLPILHVIPPSEFVIKRSFGEQVNWLDEDFGYSPEMMLQWKVYKSGGDYFGIDKCLVFRGKEPFSITSTNPVNKITKDRLLFLRQTYRFYSLSVTVELVIRIVYDFFKLRSKR